MRKFITFLSTLVMVIMPFSASLAVPTAAQAATTGLIKGPYDTVYWLSSDGKRYVFPTYNTFFSWYGYSSPAIQQMSLDQLGTITIGGNVTYKPGVRLIKVTTNPKVYAVSRYGVLRWITSEALATQLYGANWAQNVDDLPDPFFVNYNIGADINSAADFSPAQQSDSVSTPDDNIGTAVPTPSTTNPTQNVGPTAPVITTPATNQILTNYPRTLTINWNSTVRRHYVEVQCDFCGTNSAWSYVNYSANTDNYVNSVVTTALAGDNQFRVRIKAIDESNRETWSNYTYFSFKTSAASSDPVAPILTSPTANQLFTNYPRLIDVKWSNDSQKSHTVEIACDYCGTGEMWSAVSTYNVGNYATGYQGVLLAGDNQFRVRVKATDANSVAGPWSDWVYFQSSTNSLSAPSTPRITVPYQNQVYTNYPRTLTAQWFNDGAKEHTLEVACDYCASVTNMYSDPSYYVADNFATSYVLPALAGDNQFRIRVKATNENSVESAWSDYVYFTFKTPAVATTDLQITDVLFRDATVNDNLGALVGLKLNHQPYKVSLTFTNPTTGLKLTNGYSNITRSTVTPYEDSYVMLMNNLASNIDYQYSVTAEDWDGKGSVTKTGIYHSPTLSQPFAYLDYQVVGTSQQGQIVISPSISSCDSSKCGYNFVTKTLAGYSGGAFYSGYYNSQYQIFGNNLGQGGLALLANGDATPPLVSSGQYNRFGVPLTVGSWYAVYDEANQMFIKIHVAKLVTP